jgi:ribonuclease BN (tRNA processing enzyme)
MTQEEFDKAPKIEQVLYDCTGMLAENHSDIIEAMTIYAESEVKKLNLLDVSNRRELLFAFIKDWKEEFKDENWDYLDFMAERFLGKQ